MQGLALPLRVGAILAVAAALALLLAVPHAGAASPGATTAQNGDYDVPLPYLTPVPVVRLAGRVTKTGVRVTLLRIRSPRGSAVTVRCSGGKKRGCPYKSRTHTSPASSLLRFRSVEHRLKAGVKLAIFAERGNTVGKYTQFTIRKKKAPSRNDACLLPGDPFEPTGCP